ncbi:multidrug efflux SMR transporter [Arthrobacter sp. I2-34]|uniref:Multidrug efflux SMR transporter n=1 Tax=Arthrobacter hankyongi TaxID=2904801 RepID=A0ABS9LDT1_9MICC|nr:multidrug efflux SMR transporter [Arthrobacter hankyongi]MCG2624848.1 multidrug efflux SMR transporter [Arthrobacter hankyongi]
MYWAVLLASAVLEAVWATALGLSQGFTEPVPTVVFAAAGVLSMVGLGYAMRGVPLGTAYAVWTALGAVLTVAAGVLLGGEQVGPAKILFLAGIVVCVAGLKLVEGRSAPRPDAGPDAGTDAGQATSDPADAPPRTSG